MLLRFRSQKIYLPEGGYFRRSKGGRRHPDFKHQPLVVQQFNIVSDKIRIEFIVGGGDNE